MKTKWQAKTWSEKAHEGYSDVDCGDVWSLDERLADIISKHLHAFLKAEKGPNGGCPGIIVNQFGEEKAHESWLQMIRKMIYAFDEYQSVPDKFNIEPEKMPASKRVCSYSLTTLNIYGYDSTRNFQYNRNS